MRTKMNELRDATPFQSRFLMRGWEVLAKWVRTHDPERASGFRAFALRAGRVLYLTVRDFFADRCMLQSAALTYTTVLSLVPLLAFVFALAVGLGGYDMLRHDVIEPFLNAQWGAPGTGPDGIEQLRRGIYQMLDTVQNTHVGAVGGTGAIVLLYTALRLLSSVEISFNEIWGVQRARSLVRKLTDYLAMVVITPIFLFTATAVTAAAHNNSLVEWVRVQLGLGWLFDALVPLTPILTMWLLLFFVYLTLPNTKVQWSSAAIGAIVAGTLWQLVQVLHVKFQVGIANYSTLYAGFAAFPLFLVWMYFSWAIVLAGAELCWAHQAEPNFRPAVHGRDGSVAFRELVALRSLVRIARAFLRGERPSTSEAIARELGLAHGTVERVLRELEARGLVVVSESATETSFVPARDPSLITLKSVFDALRGDSAREDLGATSADDEAVDRALDKLDHELAGSAHNLSLRELVLQADREPSRASPTGVASPATRAT